MIWNFELPLLSKAEIFSKIWQILWSQLNIRKIWTVAIITRWYFRKNKAVLLNRFEKFELPLLWRASIFSNIKEFLWYHLIIWNAPIITSWNSCKNIPFLMKPFEHLNYPIIMRYNSIKCKAVFMISLPLTPIDLPLLS